MSVVPIAGDAAPAPDVREIRRSLTRMAGAFEDAARRTRGTGDSEAVHDLRVAIRRLTAALSLWRPSLRERPRLKATRRLRRLRRALGPVRELEVHVADLESRTAGQSFALRIILGDLKSGLRRELKRARRLAAGEVDAPRVRRIVRPVRRSARPAKEDSAAAAGTAVVVAAPPAPAAGAEERLAAVADRARETAIVAAALADDVSLHAARIAVKKWRYTIEAWDEVMPRKNPGAVSVAALRNAQKALGGVQDRATLRARLLGHATQLREQGLGVQAAALAPLIAEVESERRKAIEKFRSQVVALAGEAPPHAVPLEKPGE